MKLSWQEALAVVTVTGILFAIVAFTSLYKMISEAIPKNLQHGITVGIGLFLTFIGLQKVESLLRTRPHLSRLGTSMIRTSLQPALHW